MALFKAAYESYLYTLQNTAIAGPGQKGMRGDITWLVWKKIVYSCLLGAKPLPKNVFDSPLLDS